MGEMLLSRNTKIKANIGRLITPEMNVLRMIQSLCPDCVDTGKFDTMKIDSMVYEQDNKVWQIKECPEHGVFKEIYWADYQMYLKAESFYDPGIKILNPNIDVDKFDINCPSHCGLCAEHESHTGLGNIVVTNRCDLSCWYCFFYAKENEPVYEPTIDQIRMMLQRMRDEKPVGCNAIQFTGGEPTLREDLVDILKTAHDVGYEHIQLNTNGINLSQKPELAFKLRDAGLSNLYLSFDGMTPNTNPKNYWEAQSAIENCRKAGIGVVLVPTVIGGVNDHELGDIIRYGMNNLGTVRSVNFQPVSLVGRMPDKLRKKQRITIPGAIKRIEAQTEGQITKDDFFTVPCASRITDFVEAIKEEPKYRLSVHFACGMGTYVFKDGEKLVPITRFFDVDGFFDYLGELTDEIKNARYKKMAKTWVLAKLVFNIKKFMDESKKPKGLKFLKMMKGAVAGGNYHGLADLHYNSLFVGMMHFQDPYNWDIDRVHKCDIHYATPDGKIIPFCAFNVIPNLYRDAVQARFSVPAEDWEKITGKKLADDRYHRRFTQEQTIAIKARYESCMRYVGKDKRTLTPDWGENWDKEETKNPTVAEIKASVLAAEKHPASSFAVCSSGTCATVQAKESDNK